MADNFHYSGNLIALLFIFKWVIDFSFYNDLLYTLLK